MNPHVCPDRSDPDTGPIPAEVAARYVACVYEKATPDKLYLVSDMVVQVGKGRPFLAESDAGLSDIDIEQLVYPIRGSYRVHWCSQISDRGENTGKNCIIYNNPNAVGKCYRTVFADWACDMYDFPNYNVIVGYGPPPA